MPFFDHVDLLLGSEKDLEHCKQVKSTIIAVPRWTFLAALPAICARHSAEHVVLLLDRHSGTEYCLEHTVQIFLVWKDLSHSE
jgi:hypothetical protein